MSLRGRHHGERPRFEQTFGALLAALAIAAPAPPRPAGLEAQEGVRIVAEPLERQVAVAKSPAKQATGDPAPKGWTIYSNGAIDPTGTFHSSKRLRRRVLERLFAVQSGRQWVRLKRGLRERAPHLAGLPLQDFVRFVFFAAAQTGVPFEL